MSRHRAYRTLTPGRPHGVRRGSHKADPAGDRARVREALGEDPRLSVLAAKVHDLQAQLDDARARLALVTEAIRA